MAREISEFEQHALSIIKPLRTAKWQADFRWDRLEESVATMGADYGGLELNPDFQRGHVWTSAQQVQFIENCLRGVVASNGLLIQFNSPSWNDDAAGSDLPPGLQCVDGLQRYTAVTEFVKGNVKPFGFTAQELARTQFSPMRIHMKIAIHDFTRRAARSLPVDQCGRDAPQRRRNRASSRTAGSGQAVTNSRFKQTAADHQPAERGLNA